MKKTTIILAAFLLLFLFGCEKKPVGSNQAQSSSLSKTCDRILSIGVDNSGNVYELVGNQKEDHNGFSIEIGVIKNDSWLIEPTSNCPLLGNDGLFHTPSITGGVEGHDLKTVDREYFFYAGNGTFFINSPDSKYSAYYRSTGIFFNAETGKSYTLDLGLTTSLKYKTSYYNGYQIMETENGNIVVDHSKDGIEGYSHEIYLFNVSTFSLNKIVKESRYGLIGPLSEGLFATGSGYDQSVKAFYNSNGNMVIDLSSYKWNHADSYYFENGQYSFYADNDLGHRFLITIDTTGTILQEVQK